MIQRTITERGATPRVMLREQNRIAREVSLDVGAFWHDNFLEKHFTQAGAVEYGYAPRDGDRQRPNEKGFRRSYQGRKLRFKGHTKPLVFSGRSRERLRWPRLRVTATRGIATLRILLDAPAFNFKQPTSNVDMRRDITAVSAREEQAMSEHARERFLARYGALNN